MTSYLSPHQYGILFQAVRAATLRLTTRLSAEDMAVQSMPDASPTKWHLAHTTWFFETLILKKFDAAYLPESAAYAYLFNSYYEALGERLHRPLRGLLTRPNLSDVLAYRAQVDAAVLQWLAAVDGASWEAARPLLLLGLHHEQQHQELILTDMLHLLAQNPVLPTWFVAADVPMPMQSPPQQQWLKHPGGLHTVGTNIANLSDPLVAFAFDNESPQHQVWLQPFALSNRLVSCAEYLAFMQDGGYHRPELWLSQAWALVQAEAWQAPLYWVRQDDKRHTLRQSASVSSSASSSSQDWQVFGLHGLTPLQSDTPVTHLSFYEASAYAAWAGARLPTEFEWEVMARSQMEQASNEGLQDLYGKAWQWTRSSYDPYPGFKALAGDATEYNGKFMVGQLVLRGSSAYTSTEPFMHSRLTYRNFFPPAARWQCTGLRLAMDTTSL